MVLHVYFKLTEKKTSLELNQAIIMNTVLIFVAVISMALAMPVDDYEVLNRMPLERRAGLGDGNTCPGCSWTPPGKCRNTILCQN